MANGTKISVTWIELILLLIVTAGGLGSWNTARELAGKRLEIPSPREEEFEQRLRVAELQRALTAAEEEWKATLVLQNEQRLAIERSAVRIAILETKYAALRDPAATGSLPEDLRASYQKALEEKSEAEALESRLSGKLQSIESRLDSSTQAVADARHAARQALEEARTGRSRALAWQTTGWGIAGAVMFLLIALGALAARAPRGTRVRRSPVIATAASLLAILFLYELAGSLSLMLGSLIALAVLTFLLREA